MAPRKKTEEKVSADDKPEMILRYLRKQNRPFSALEVSANLGNKVTKTLAAKILKDLHEQKQIEGRSAGKQLVYHALQDASETCTPEQLVALDNQITHFRNQANTLNATAKTLRSALASLNSTLSTADLIANVQALDAEKTEIVSRLERLKAGKVRKVTQLERDGIEKEWLLCRKVAKSRQKIVEGMWRLIEDNVQDKERREELRESLGLDD